MLRNYWLMAWRNIRKRKGHSLINTFGLSLGLGLALLIFIWVQDDLYRMLVIGYHPERTYQFVSKDGDEWKSVGNGPWFDLGGWHTFYTRPACIVPMGPGWLFVYEGSHPTWFDPPYNIATGLAWTMDLETCIDLTPTEPYRCSWIGSTRLRSPNPESIPRLSWARVLTWGRASPSVPTPWWSPER